MKNKNSKVYGNVAKMLNNVGKMLNNVGKMLDHVGRCCGDDFDPKIDFFPDLTSSEFGSLKSIVQKNQ